MGLFLMVQTFPRTMRGRSVIPPPGSEAPSGAQERTLERSCRRRVAIHAVKMPILRFDCGHPIREKQARQQALIAASIAIASLSISAIVVFFE